MTLAYIGQRVEPHPGQYLTASDGPKFTAEEIAAAMICAAVPPTTLQIVAAGPVAWLEPVASQVARLAAAPDQDGGPPRVSDHAWHRTGQFLQAFMKSTTLAPILVPTAAGGVHLEWHSRGWDVEVEIPPKGAVTIVIDDPDGGEWEGTLQVGIPRFGKALSALS